MAEYPQVFRVGEAPYQELYVLQRNQLLLQFQEGMPDERIDAFLRQLGFRARRAENPPRDAGTLRKARMRWVEFRDSIDALHDFADGLVRQHDEIVMAAPVYYREGQGAESAASPMAGTIVVRLTRQGDNETLAALQRQFGLKLNEQMSSLLKPFYYFHVPSPQETPANAGDAFDILRRLSEWTSIDSAEFDWLKLQTYQFVPNDTFWANQWDMAQINLVNAWDVQTGQGTVWLAIIDSDFDLTHPDLAFTPNTGATLTHFNADEAIAGDPPPYDASSVGVFHGTSVAGIAAATLNNAIGVAGVAGGCQIMPVRLGPIPTADRVAAGINWAAANGARVGNLSLTTTATAAATAAVANAWAAGMVLCAATGNGGQNTASPPVGFPANHANTIAVGASDQADQRKRPASADGECWGSQFGPEVDVVAPGVLCWSTDEQGGSGYNSNNGGPISWACVNYGSSGDATGNYVALFNGTSAATPHVVGLAGLLFSQYPALTNQQVRDIIERTCSKVNPALYPYAHDPARPNGTWHQEMGYGRINCDAALRYTDIMISDHAFDTGAVPSSTFSGGAWTPAVFWRYQPYVTTTSQPAALPSAHQPALAGQDNYVHAYVTNLGPADATNVQVTWHIMDYPGTELIWPSDWNAGNQIASAAVPLLAANTSIAVEALWPQALVNIASAYAHPCMVVAATAFNDIGGAIGPYVYEYNNIAQHNISFGGFSSPGSSLADRTFTLPFAVGNAVSIARSATLYFDLRGAAGAAVFLDLNPPDDLPYVDRIRAAGLKPLTPAGKDRCQVTALEDTKLLFECCGCRAEVTLKAKSAIRLACRGAHGAAIDVRQVKTKNATVITRAGRELLRLSGAVAMVTIPLEEGQVVPMAMTMEAPGGAAPGDRFRADVTQVSDGTPTGGVTLDVEAR